MTRGQLPQRAGSLGLTAVGLPPRYPQQMGRLDWIVQCLTSPPTQYRLYGRRFLQVKRPNQQYQSTEGEATKDKSNNGNNTNTQMGRNKQRRKMRHHENAKNNWRQNSNFHRQVEYDLTYCLTHFGDDLPSQSLNYQPSQPITWLILTKLNTATNKNNARTQKTVQENCWHTQKLNQMKPTQARDIVTDSGTLYRKQTDIHHQAPFPLCVEAFNPLTPTAATWVQL